MGIPLHELEAQVLALEAHERAHLLDRLLGSFEPEDEVRRAWVTEALRRKRDVETGLVKMVPGEEAMARVRARFG